MVDLFSAMDCPSRKCDEALVIHGDGGCLLLLFVGATARRELDGSIDRILDRDRNGSPGIANDLSLEPSR